MRYIYMTPPSMCIPPPGIKRLWIETDHSSHLVPRLKMSGEILLLTPHTFRACSGATSPIPCTNPSMGSTWSPLNLNHYFSIILSSHPTLGLTIASFHHIFSLHFHMHPITLCATYFRHLITLDSAILILTAQYLQCVDTTDMTSSYICSIYMHYAKNNM
jgi:hypothetical protein